MTREILCKPPKGKAYPVQLKPLRFGNTFVISIEGNGGPPIQLAGSPKILVPFLRGLLEAIESKSDYAEPAPPVVVEEPVEELPPADPDSRPRVTAFGLRDKTPETQLELMIEYFNSAPAPLRNTELITELQRRYKAITDRHYKPRKKDEIGQAVAKLRPYRAELLDEKGQPRHGAKTQVASIMRFKQTGGGFARKIDLYLAALAEAA